MKRLIQYLLIITMGVSFSGLLLAQDNPEGKSFIYDVPQHIQQLQEEIRAAETNEDWTAYYSLRQQLISAWQEVKPEVAALYRTTNSLENDKNNPDAPQMVESFGGTVNNRWGTDIRVHTGNAADISLIVSRGDILYLAALDNIRSGVFIYVSTDGGTTWSYFKYKFAVNPSSKIELLDFDGFQGATGPSYLLLFTLYDSGTLWCTRFNTEDSSYVNSTVVQSGCSDFSVDRNYPSSNYRCFVLYDTANTQFRKRSDPASYGTLWQDPKQIFSCHDPDITYGFNGSLYSVYIGNSSHNLYLNSDYSYGDPSFPGIQITLAGGTTDTTFNPEVIASRHDTAAQTIFASYGKLSNNRNVLYSAVKFPGQPWDIDKEWVTLPSNNEHKYSQLFCRRANIDAKFQGIYVRSGLANSTPREIRIKKYGAGWSGSLMISDSSSVPTGAQNPVVVELSTGVAAYAYAGSSSTNVYFDREDWAVTGISAENLIPEAYSLEQNFPNPFNPNTVIRFSIPEQTNVSLKIYNMLGQELETLINGELSAGTHEFNFNADNLSSGIYIYKIQAGNYSNSKKMIFMK